MILKKPVILEIRVNDSNQKACHIKCGFLVYNPRICCLFPAEQLSWERELHMYFRCRRCLDIFGVANDNC